MAKQRWLSSLSSRRAILYLDTRETIGSEESFTFGGDVFPFPFEEMDSSVPIRGRVGIFVRLSDAEQEKSAEWQKDKLHFIVRQKRTESISRPASWPYTISN